MQQINLFKQIPVIAPKKQVISNQQWVMIIASIWVLFIGYFIYVEVRNSQLKSQLAILSVNEAQVMQKLDELKVQYPEETQVALQQKSQAIESEIAAKQKLLDLLEHTTSTGGFSAKLDALANTIIPSVWLTSISFNDKDDFVGLAGNALSSEDILKFIENLSANNEFKSYKFQSFNIGQQPVDETKSKKKDDKNTIHSPIITFALSNEFGRNTAEDWSEHAE